MFVGLAMTAFQWRRLRTVPFAEPACVFCSQRLVRRTERCPECGRDPREEALPGHRGARRRTRWQAQLWPALVVSGGVRLNFPLMVMLVFAVAISLPLRLVTVRLTRWKPVPSADIDWTRAAELTDDAPSRIE